MKYVLFCTLFWLSVTGATEVGQISPAFKAKPREVVVLLHGLGRNPGSMWLLDRRLSQAGFTVVRVGYDSLYDDTVADMVANVSAQINHCCAHIHQKVHFVGHSLGGLLIRAYLGQYRVANLGHVVQIGPPNHGTPIVDKFAEHPWMRYAGPITLALGTQPGNFPSRLPKPYYPVGVIAGVANTPFSKLIPGPDDGLVPLSSTQLNGMTDYIIVRTGHGRMRYHKQVAAQVVQFLRTGRFRRK